MQHKTKRSEYRQCARQCHQMIAEIKQRKAHKPAQHKHRSIAARVMQWLAR